MPNKATCTLCKKVQWTNCGQILDNCGQALPGQIVDKFWTIVDKPYLDK